jgi:hypothetical protein
MSEIKVKTEGKLPEDMKKANPTKVIEHTKVVKGEKAK